MRVIANTRWTASAPRTSTSARSAAPQPALGERDQPQPARVHELELAQVEHDPADAVLAGQPVDLLVERRRRRRGRARPSATISASPALVSVVVKARGATST